MSSLQPITTKEHCFMKIYQLMTHTHPAGPEPEERRPVGMSPYVDYVIDLQGKFDPDHFNRDLQVYLMMVMNKLPWWEYAHTAEPGRLIIKTLARPDQWYERTVFQIPPEVTGEETRSHL